MLLNNDYKFCSVCHTRLNLESGKFRRGFTGRLRCSNRTCRKSYSPFLNNIFSVVLFSASKIFDLIYSFAENNTIEESLNEASVSNKRACKYFKIFRNAIRTYGCSLQNAIFYNIQDGEYEIDENSY